MASVNQWELSVISELLKHIKEKGNLLIDAVNLFVSRVIATGKSWIDGKNAKLKYNEINEMIDEAIKFLTDKSKEISGLESCPNVPQMEPSNQWEATFISFKLKFLEDQGQLLISAISQYVSGITDQAKSWTEGKETNRLYTEIREMIEKAITFLSEKSKEVAGASMIVNGNRISRLSFDQSDATPVSPTTTASTSGTSGRHSLAPKASTATTSKKLPTSQASTSTTSSKITTSQASTSTTSFKIPRSEASTATTSNKLPIDKESSATTSNKRQESHVSTGSKSSKRSATLASSETTPNKKRASDASTAATSHSPSSETVEHAVKTLLAPILARITILEDYMLRLPQVIQDVTTPRFQQLEDASPRTVYRYAFSAESWLTGRCPVNTIGRYTIKYSNAGPSFDELSGVFTSPVDGTYVVSVSLWMKERGELRVAVRSSQSHGDNTGTIAFMCSTTIGSTTACKVGIVPMVAGDRLFVCLQGRDREHYDKLVAFSCFQLE